MLRSLSLAVTILIAVSSTSLADPVRVVVASDEWVLSNSGFADAPDTDEFLLNVAAFITGGRGVIHAYTTSFGATGSTLVTTLTNAGYTYTSGDGFELTTAVLSAYDALMMDAHDLSPDELQAINDFIDAGGGLYIFGGTATDAGPVADAINPVIERYGVYMLPSLNNAFGVVDVTTADDPLFEDISGLYHVRGNRLSGSWIQAPYGPEGEGLFAVVRDLTPVEVQSWTVIKNAFR